MMGSAARIIFVFVVFAVIAMLKHAANGSSEGTRYKTICQTNLLSSNCLKEKVEKPVSVFNTISFFFGNKKRNKKKEREKGITTEASSQYRSSSAVTTLRPDPVLQYKRVQKNIHNLENDGCGIGLETRILGGENTLPGEFPWLARLKYKEKSTGKKFYACGGSLITPQYILTAAHCLNHHALKLQSVRLGEYNTRMYAMECSENAINSNNFMEMDTCEPARDYDVKNHKVHEQFKRVGDLAHDIGIVRLLKSVIYTRYIQPICLPVGRYKLNLNFGSDLMSAGWGMTEKSEGSEIPLKARTPLMEMEACRHLVGRDLTPGQLCVGGANGSSTCHGDSGGPLVLKTLFYENDNSVDDFLHNGYNRTILVGIISGGSKFCKIEPTLFINVEDYLWWILINIKT